MSLIEVHISSLDAGPWSYSLPAVRTVNSCMESLPPPPGPAESSPHLLLSPSPRTHPQTAGASSPSTSPSSLGAKLLTWLPSAAPQMAMQACTHPCPHSARPLWISTNCMCPALLRAKSLMRERTRRTRWRIPPCPNKVGQQETILSKLFWFAVLMFLTMRVVFVMTQISLCEKKVTMIQTRVMTGTQKPLPPSHQPPRKTSNAKTPQVHCVLDMCSDIR